MTYSSSPPPSDQLQLIKLAAYTSAGLVGAAVLTKVLFSEGIADGSGKRQQCPARPSALATGEQQTTEGNRRLFVLGQALMAKITGKSAAAADSMTGGYKTGDSATKSHFSFPKLSAQVDPPVLIEKGAKNKQTGEEQTSDSRQYFQVLVLACQDLARTQYAMDNFKKRATADSIPCALYNDTNNPCSFGIVTWSRDPEHFATKVRQAVQYLGSGITVRPGWTMLGRSYSAGHEADLKDYLFKKPVRAVLHPDRKWAVWYPMRRDGSFYMLPPGEQCRMLLHHAAIGKSYAEVDAAHDVRLASFGIDAEDNEFLVGLIGTDLYGLSKIVQDMRKTEHTSNYLKSLGPFFVGYRVWTNGTVEDA